MDRKDDALTMEYSIMHGNHLAFTTQKRFKPGDVIAAADILLPDRTAPEDDVVRCGTCGQEFSRSEFAQLIVRAQHPLTQAVQAQLTEVPIDNETIDQVRGRLQKLETATRRLIDRADKLETRAEKLETRAEKLETRTGKLETAVKALQDRITPNANKRG